MVLDIGVAQGVCFPSDGLCLLFFFYSLCVWRFMHVLLVFLALCVFLISSLL